ncbi:MAG: hypothetical protein KKB59_04170, partial [Spirochaetes bacterium]|nr:hypothetical protein [Spirochaetota bacterium]
MRIKDTFALTLTIGAAATTLLIAAATVVGREHPAAPPPGLSIVLKYAAGDTRRTSMQLRELDDSYAELAGAGVSTNANYAYLWIRAENSTLRDIEAVFANRTRNYYTEILEPMPLGARILHRQGDIVPVSESPMRHHRTAFPIIAPAGKAVEFVVEYHGPRGIVIDPVVLGTADYLSFALSERSMGSLVSGALFCLLFFNTASGLMLGKKYFFAIAAFIAALSFFYLRQSRLLMLIIDPLFYPEWLFPLTISLNLASAMAFSRSVFGRRMTGLETWTIRGIVVAAVLLTAAGAALAPYAIADILNLLSIVALCATLPSVYRSYAAGEKEPIWLFISFSPWIAMMLMDILTGFLGRRASPLGEYRHAFSLVASLFLLSITLQKMQGLAAEARAKAATLEMERMRTNMDGRLGSLSELRTALLERIDHRLRQPLDGIIASARLLERSYAVPRVAAASRLIVDEATELKRSVASELNLERSVPGPGPDAGAVPAGDDADDADEGDDAGDRDDELTIKPALRSRVAIFDADSRNAERTRRIIKA